MDYWKVVCIPFTFVIFCTILPMRIHIFSNYLFLIIYCIGNKFIYYNLFWRVVVNYLMNWLCFVLILLLVFLWCPLLSLSFWKRENGSYINASVLSYCFLDLSLTIIVVTYFLSHSFFPDYLIILFMVSLILVILFYWCIVLIL